MTSSPKPLLKSPAGSQRGMSVVTALFLITLMAALLVGSLNMIYTASRTELQTLQYLQAQQAAAAGIEYARYQAAVPATPVCAANTNITNLPGTLARYVVSVSCVIEGPFSDGATTLRRYRFSAVACNQALPVAATARCPNNAAAGAVDSAWHYVEGAATGEWWR